MSTQPQFNESSHFPSIHRPKFGGEAKFMSVHEARLVVARWDRAFRWDWMEQSNYASALFVLGEIEKAELNARDALSKERNTSTLMNLAVILEAQGRFEEAFPLEVDACLMDVTDPFAGVLYANAVLRLGHWKEGWPLYHQYVANLEWLRMVIPEWSGLSAPLKGKRILVLEGGGYGDFIFNLRWVPQLRKMGAHVTLKCPPRFGSLAQYIGIADRILGGDNTGQVIELRPADYDYFVSALTLPMHFGVTPENYRWDGPYIKFTSIGDYGGVGLCWKSGELEAPRRHRSLNSDQLNRLLSHELEWVNLTYDEPTPARIRDAVIIEWLDTAALVKSMRLVVTTDTGVAHLAGAMGIPTWVILPGISAWQYLLGSDLHPLYPSMRLFRNKGEGIDNAVDAVCKALEEL